MRFSSENWHNTDNINSNFSTLLPRTTKLGRNKSIYNFVTFYNKIPRFVWISLSMWYWDLTLTIEFN